VDFRLILQKLCGAVGPGERTNQSQRRLSSIFLHASQGPLAAEEVVGMGTKIVRQMLPSDQAVVNSFSFWMASENLANSLLFSASQ
jgi:hypothetical protein